MRLINEFIHSLFDMNNNYTSLILLFFILNIGIPNKSDLGKNKISFVQSDSTINENKISTPQIDNQEIKGEKIIEKYISAIGGKEAINKIMDRTTYITGKVQSMNIHIVVYQKIPNKYYQKIELGAAEQKIIFDGEKGIMITNDNKQEIKGLDFEKLKYESAMPLMLYPSAYGVKIEFKGVEKVKGNKAYKIVLKFPGGMEWTQYYDTTTYLKIEEIKPVNSPDNRVINQATFFSNYQEAEGVKYPFTIKQILGQSKFEFHVDSIKVNAGLSDRNFDIE